MLAVLRLVRQLLDSKQAWAGRMWYRIPQEKPFLFSAPELRETVEFLYESGAEEVHMRSACPPIMYSCKYLNLSRGNSDMDLLARRTVQELEGDEGQQHLEEYADANTQRGQCIDVYKRQPT